MSNQIDDYYNYPGGWRDRWHDWMYARYPILYKEFDGGTWLGCGCAIFFFGGFYLLIFGWDYVQDSLYPTAPDAVWYVQGAHYLPQNIVQSLVINPKLTTKDFGYDEDKNDPTGDYDNVERELDLTVTNKSISRLTDVTATVTCEYSHNGDNTSTILKEATIYTFTCHNALPYGTTGILQAYDTDMFKYYTLTSPPKITINYAHVQ